MEILTLLINVKTGGYHKVSSILVTNILVPDNILFILHFAIFYNINLEQECQCSFGPGAMFSTAS